MKLHNHLGNRLMTPSRKDRHLPHPERDQEVN